MRKLAVCIQKEWLLLGRDKIALAILFLMPMFFVLVISILQSSTLTNVKSIPVLFYSPDHGNFSSLVQNQFPSMHRFHPVDAKQVYGDINSAKLAVASGKEQVLIVIPENFSAKFEKYSKQQLVQTEDGTVQFPKIQLYFDPAINSLTREVVIQSLKQTLQQFQLQMAGQVVSGILGTAPAKNTFVDAIEIKSSDTQQQHFTPDPGQQNVPAWSIFGMFFIVIPIAGIIIKERDLKISQRLAIAPISTSGLIVSRLIAFSSVNLIQLSCMLLVGVLILPLSGLPRLVPVNPVMILLTGILTAMAASSFGMLIGNYAKTQEQASALGPLLVVMAAAIGGIMIPVYLMPPSLQFISHWSPLNWSQTAFVDIFVRHAGMGTLWPQFVKLSLFVIGCLGLVFTKIRTSKS